MANTAALPRHEQIMVAAAQEAIGRIAPAEDAITGTLLARTDARLRIREDYRLAYAAMVEQLADLADAGDTAARAWVAGMHGDLQFDPEGEEFGHYKTYPSRDSLRQRLAAFDGRDARRVLEHVADSDE